MSGGLERRINEVLRVDLGKFVHAVIKRGAYFQRHIDCGDKNQGRSAGRGGGVRGRQKLYRKDLEEMRSSQTEI